MEGVTKEKIIQLSSEYTLIFSWLNNTKSQT